VANIICSPVFWKNAIPLTLGDKFLENFFEIETGIGIAIENTCNTKMFDSDFDSDFDFDRDISEAV
jgi:hypothetical protein